MTNIFSVSVIKLRRDLDFAEENLDTENPQNKNAGSKKKMVFLREEHTSSLNIYIQAVFIQIVEVVLLNLQINVNM